MDTQRSDWDGKVNSAKLKMCSFFSVISIWPFPPRALALIMGTLSSSLNFFMINTKIWGQLQWTNTQQFLGGQNVMQASFASETHSIPLKKNLASKGTTAT